MKFVDVVVGASGVGANDHPQCGGGCVGSYW